MRRRRGRLVGGAESRAEIERLMQQLEELREENERLRVDATRPRSPAELSGRLAELAAAAGSGAPDVASLDAADERLDQAWYLYAEAQRMRLAVIDVLNELQVACGQLERQLRLDAGPMEIDRRVVERRRDTIATMCGVDDCDRRVAHAHNSNGHNGNGHNGNGSATAMETR